VLRTAPASAGLPPIEKLPPPWATAWEGLLPVLRMYTLLERSYSTRTTMKRINFSRRFDKPDLNFPKVYTHSQSSGYIRIQSEIITQSRTVLSFTFQHSKKPAKYKNDSQNCKIAFSISKLLSKSILSTCQRRNCKKNYRRSCLNGSEQTHFSRPAVCCEPH